MLKKMLGPVVVFLLALCVMVALNLSMPRLGQNCIMPDALEGIGYRLDPLRQGADGVYEIRIENPDGVSGAALVLAAMRPFEAQINGETVYRYTSDTPYRRLHILPLSGEARLLDVRILSGQEHMKVMLTSLTRSASLSALYQNFSSMMIGIYIAMLFFSLILYEYKRTEKYLLAEIFAVLTVILTTVFTSGIFPLNMTERSYDLIQRCTDAVRSPILIACCVALLQPAGAFAGVRRNAMPVLAVVIACFLGASCLKWNVPYEIMGFGLNAFGLVYVCTSPEQKGMPQRLFSYVCAVRLALMLYTTFNNKGVLPNSELMVYFYMPQLSCMLILFCCMALVNIRFAGKFQQVDALSAELEKANEELDEKVAQRTRDLEIQQQKRRMMMTNIFHDLRSPLFIASGCVDMLRVDGAENEQCLAAIRDKLQYLSTLTEQLFLIAKLEEKKITFASVEVDLDQVCRMLVNEYSLKGQAGHVELRYACDDSGCTVTGDGFRLRQALENLLHNAVKFCDKEHGRVCIRLSSSADQVTLAVADNGKGISQEDLPHVFERYYTGHNTDKVRSTGLGLAIAHEIILAHHGRIAVQSEIGSGTCFTIEIPRAR